jgi:hypothetical protein
VNRTALFSTAGPFNNYLTPDSVRNVPVLGWWLRNVLGSREGWCARMVPVTLLAATHSGMTTDEFEKVVSDWIATAKHPRTGRLYTEMAYQPMRTQPGETMGTFPGTTALLARLCPQATPELLDSWCRRRESNPHSP